MGNHATGCSWQSSWQAMDIDDFVLSTTYVGPSGNSGSDTTTPSIPAGLSATAASSSQINLTWSASSDNIGVTGYRIYRNGTLLTTSTTTSYSNTGLAASTSYSYRISAIDAAGNESAQSAAVTATTKAATTSDTTAPSIPAGLSATAISSSQVNLSWTASTDNVGVTGYKVYRGGALIATSTTTAYADSGLTAATAYSYQITAIDAAGNESGKSTAVSATTQAAASGGTAGTTLLQEGFDDSSFATRGWYDATTHGTIVSGGQTGNALQWAWAQGATKPTNGSAMRKKITPTDSLYVSFYVKFQTGWRGSQKTYHPHMFYIPSDLDSDWTALANNYLNTYIEFVSDVGGSYAIRPSMAIQDEMRVNTANGTLPNNLTATTENRSVAYCNTPVPTGVTGSCYADNPYYSANTWKASNASVSSNVWHKVEVYLKMNTISNGKGLSNGIMQQWLDGTQVINRNDVLYRTAQDATKKWGQFVLAPWIGDGSPIAQTMWLDELTVATAPPASSGSGDVLPPTTPSGITATAASASQIGLSWTAATDNTAVTGYKIYRNGTYLTTATTTSYTDTGLTASTAYSYKVSAIDAAGNESAQSAAATATTQAPPDTTPPSVPSGVSASATSSTQINLAWTAATDNVGVTGYKVYRNATYLATTTATSYSNTGLTASTSYSYKVSAIDAAGNESGQSATATATTQAAAVKDSTAPTVTAFAIPATATSLTVPITTFTATDNVAVSGYLVSETSAAPLATAAGWSTTARTSYTFASAGSKTLYAWAKDAAGNVSASRNATVGVNIPANLSSIWDTSIVPALPAVTDGQPLEVGVKFRADVDGSITALRFYKGAANTGVHVGNLWTGTGTLLASATYAGETASGWQEVQLSTPVAIKAGTTYVASCYSSSGYYAANNNYFAAAVNNPPLKALANGEDGSNGLYKYGASGFPTLSWNASNYWVDVVFSPGGTAVPLSAPSGFKMAGN